MHLVCAHCGAVNRIADEHLDHEPTCGRCKAELMARRPAALTDAVFEKFVARTELPVLVDFWAEWCGPCKTVAPVVEELAREHAGKLKVVKLNIDHFPLAASAYHVQSIPTLMLFKDGQPIERMVGALPKQAILQKLVAHLA